MAIAILALAAATLSGSPAALACQAPDKDAAIARVLAEHPGGKILKVEQKSDAKNCVNLKIRVLVNGTVKLVVIKGS